MSIFVQIVLNSIIAASVYSLIALGFNLVYGTARFFNLAHGTMALIGAYAVYVISIQFGASYGVSIPLGIAAAGFVGVILDKSIYGYLRTRKSSKLILLIASLGTMTALGALLAMIFSSQFFPLLTDGAANPTLTIFGGSITVVQLTMLGAALAVYVLLWLLLYRTMFGKAVRAISDDREVAEIVGIDTNTIISWVFFIGSGIAGLAGILIGMDTGIQPSMGLFLLLGGAVACIIGGIGNITGGIIGALILAFSENFGVWALSGEWKSAIAFGLLIFFLLFRPQGVMNVKDVK